MTDTTTIDRLLETLEELIEEAEQGERKWREVWSEIRDIGQAFKGSRFPSPQERQAAWSRFQSLVEKVKRLQQQARQEFEDRIRESEGHLGEILSYVSAASPSSGLDDVIVAIGTGGLSVVAEAVLDALLGPSDRWKADLQERSRALKQGWAYYTGHKDNMLGKHRAEAVQALRQASSSLEAAWQEWKAHRQKLLEQYRSQKQAEREARAAKRQAWQNRVREKISRLEDQLERLGSALERRKSNLARLEEMQSSARSDAYRERVETWIGEEQERIEEVRNRILRTEGWLSELKAKLA